MTLIEVSVMFTVVLSISSAALLLAHHLSRQETPADGRRLEAVLLRWRQEARTGVEPQGQGVVANGHHWTWGDGHLTRNGIPLVAAEVRPVAGPPGLVVVEVRQPGLPPRTVELVRAGGAP